MSFNYYLLLPVVLLLLFLLLRSFFSRKKNLPGELFAKALRNENSGQYEEAVVAYTDALRQVQKSRFRDSHLRDTILEKLKVLHTTIEYQRTFSANKTQPVNLLTVV